MIDWTEVLHAIMLICFGFSWPINLIKNIKLKSAKIMNLPFLILIIVGYIAGITSRIIDYKFGYVFVIYVINLCVVSANLIVYFINRRYDIKNNIH